MKPHRVGDGERSLAVFIDFENMGLGFNNSREKFEINKVLERLVEKGKIVAKKAYADWSRFASYTTGLHEAAIELVEIPRRGMSGKNSADIRLVVDAMDLAYSKDHIDTFVIVSGDSDFSPLVSKLKELGKHVIGLGLADATSDLLRDNCDEFIYYEDLDRAPIIPVSVNEQIPEKKRKVFALLLDSLLALRRENKEIIYSSMLKDTIKRKKPSFNEEYYGYRTFSELLEDAQRYGLIEIEKHKSSGMYVVNRFGLEMKGGTATNTTPTATRNGNGSSGSGRTAEAARPTPPDLPAPPARASTPPAAATTAAAASTAHPAPERVKKPSATRPTRPAEKPPPQSPPPQSPPPAERTLLLPDEPIAPLERPLGRALVEEIDDLYDPDEVPSYPPARPERPVSKPAAAPKPTGRPSATAKPSGKAAPAVNTSPAAHTRRTKPGSKPPPSAPGQQDAASKPPPTAPPAPPSAANRAKPAKPPPAPPPDEDDFGAGLV